MKVFKFYKTSCFLLLGLMLGCNDAKEDDDVFETPIEQRLGEQLKFYLDALQSSPEGWRLDYQPNPDAFVSRFHLTFHEDLSADIVSDIGGGAFDLPTTYRVSKTHIPELVIESYSAFHFLFEVNGFSNNAEFQFNFVSVKDDEIVLVSKTDSENDTRTVLTLTRATSSDKQTVISFRENLGALGDQFNSPNCFRNIQVRDAGDNILLDGAFEGDSGLRTGEICYLDALGQENSIQLSFEPTAQGVVALNPFEIAGKEIRNFVYNPEENTLISTDGGLQTTIAYSNSPSDNACSSLAVVHSEQFTTEIPRTWDIVNASVPIGTDVFSWENNFGGATISTFRASTAAAGSQISNWLVSPVWEISNGDFIEFWTMAWPQSSFADRLEVRLSTAGEDTMLPQIGDAQDVGDFTTVLLDINPLEQTNVYPIVWTRMTIEIEGLSGSTACRVAFRHRVSDGFVNGNGVRVDAVEHFGMTCE